LTGITIVEYTSNHQLDFERLNKHWIEKYFWMEPVDHEVLSKPEEYIINKGGFIFMATYENEPAGTVALKFVAEGPYEFTKMAVDEKLQGLKIGKELAAAAIQKAKEKGASKIILYSNTKLIAAIALYRKLGFQEVPLDGPYQRSDIKLELLLD